MSPFLQIYATKAGDTQNSEARKQCNEQNLQNGNQLYATDECLKAVQSQYTPPVGTLHWLTQMQIRVHFCLLQQV